MSTTVLVARRTGFNVKGDASYGTDVSYPAHISGKRTMVRNALGQEVVSSQAVYVGTKDPILMSDRITLSTADVTSTDSASIRPPVLSVLRRFDEMGGHHTVVYLA